MSALTQTVIEESAPALQSEQVLLASRMERVRRGLLMQLLDNSLVAGYIGRRLLVDLAKGTDCSDIILIKNSDSYKAMLRMLLAGFAKTATIQAIKQPEALLCGEALPVTSNVVQKVNFVQLEGAGFEQFPPISDAERHLMGSLHFLPVFLIDFVGLIDSKPLMAATLDTDYRNRLRQARNELQSLRQQMIANNTGLVAFVAHKYKTSTLSFEDLMQEGLVGLIKAVDRFDPDRGICFSTYAIYWIKQAISRLIVKQDKVVPLPVALAEKSSAVLEAMRTCYLQNERWPTIAELKACCDLPEQEIKTISSYYQSTHALDTSSDEEDDNMDTMAKMQQQQFSLPLDELIDSDLAQYMDKAVASLPEKQATILAMRFGLKNHTEMTLQAVADHLNVTRERVRQIQNEALKKLKQQFGFDLMLFLEPNDS